MKLEVVLRPALRCACVGKRRYDSYEEAVRTAEQRTRPGARDYAKFLQPYACEHGCGGYHLTSRPFRDRIEQFPVVGEWST